MFAITISHEKEGVFQTSDLNGVQITEEGLDYALTELSSNMGLDIEKVEKDGVVLGEQEISALTTRYPFTEKGWDYWSEHFSGNNNS